MARAVAPQYVRKRGFEDFYLAGSLELKGGLLLGGDLNLGGNDLIGLPGGFFPVDSVHGRTGSVIGVAGDYDSTKIDNSSGVPGATVTVALDNL